MTVQKVTAIFTLFLSYAVRLHVKELVNSKTLKPLKYTIDYFVVVGEGGL